MKKFLLGIAVFITTVMLCVVSAGAAQIDGLFDNMSFEQVEKFYYNQLTDFEKKLYDRLVEDNYQSEEFFISYEEAGDMSFEEVRKSVDRAYSAYIDDDPYRGLYKELSCNQIAETDAGYLAKFKKNIAAYEYNLEKSDARIEQIIETIKSNDRYTTLKKLWNYINDTTWYNVYYLESNEKTMAYDHTAYGVFIKNRSVCGGYAHMAKIICSELEIPCIVVSTASHAWNFVQMDDGKWYSIDFTNTHIENLFLTGDTEIDYIEVEDYHITELGVGIYDFPGLSDTKYEYTGAETDFSYTEAELDFIEPETTFIYTVNEDGTTCTINDCYGKGDGNLTIPEKIDGYTVTAIGREAFSGCTVFDGKLTIPDTIKSIGPRAFADCVNLKGSLTLPSELETIEDMAFYHCPSFTGNLIIPQGIKRLYATFMDCTGLTGDIILPEELTLCDSAFAYCTGLDGKLYWPKNLKWDPGAIEQCRFKEYEVSKESTKYCTIDGILYSKDKTKLIACPRYKEGEITFAEGLKVIGENAFDRCEKVKGSVILPDSLETIELGAFQCSSFDGEIKFGNSLKLIGAVAFFQINTHGDLIIPDSVTDIGSGAFENMYNMKGTLKLPKNLEIISEWAFHSGFTGELIIPDSVTKIPSGAFWESEFDKIYLNNVTEIEQHGIPHTNIVCKCTNDESIEYVKSNELPYTLEHGKKEFVSETQPTCTKEGVKTYTCSDCGKNYTEIIETTAHNYTKTVVTPTYTEQGYTYHECSICGDNYKDNFVEKLVLSNMSGFKLGGRTSTALRLNWTANESADGYIIEMYKDGKWTRVKKITSNATTTCRVTGLAAGTAYKFRMRAYVMDGSTALYSDYTSTLSARTNPSNVTGLKIGGRSSNALRLNWTKNTSADGYIVEQYKSGKWVRIKKITSNATTTYRVTGLKASTQYKFRIKAYKMSGSTALYSGYTSTLSAYTNPSNVANLKITGKSGTALRLGWSKNTSADGYIVEMYKGGKWVRVAKISSNATVTYRKAGLTKGTTYKFRVRTYNMVGKTALYGGYVNVSGTTNS